MKREGRDFTGEFTEESCVNFERDFPTLTKNEFKALAFDVSSEWITLELSLIGPIFVVIRFPSKDLTVFQKSLAEVASLNFDSQ